MSYAGKWFKEICNNRPHLTYNFDDQIKGVGTDNDQIKGVGTLSSPSCKHTNVLGIFNKQQRRKRSHGHRHYNKKKLLS